MAAMRDVVVFAEPRVGFAFEMLDAFLRELDGRHGVSRVRVCVTSKEPVLFWQAAKSLLGFALKALFNPRAIGTFDRPQLMTMRAIARRYGAEVIEPPRNDINDPAFIRDLTAGDPVTHAVCFACLQIWRSDLLRAFDLAVNYHNGYLPDYKGLWATQWSVYRGEEYSGYAFHVMSETIDAGPIILRGRVAVPADAEPMAVGRAKRRAARNDLGKVLDAMESEDVNPMPQPGGGSYFSGKATMALRRIDEPSTLTAEEYDRRLRCFAPLQIKLGDTRYSVTALSPAGRRSPALSFKTADGVKLYPTRLHYLPTWLHRIGAGIPFWTFPTGD
jgi:methionyl-tRNA formyltransferase